MNIIHVMADGTVRDSVEDVVIESEQFYRVANGILEKWKKVLYEARQETECSPV